MGPMFILMFWALAATVLSVIGGAVLGGTVWLLTRKLIRGRKRAITIAALLPAAGFAYLFCCVAIFAIWSMAQGKDMGWGDSWDTAVLANYNIEMIDVTDHGVLYNRADKNVSDGDGSLHFNPSDRDVIDGVRRLQVADPYIFGAVGPDDFARQGAPSPENRFFIMDTRSNSRTDYPSLADLDNAARSLRSPLALQPTEAVYNQHRYSRLDLLLGGLLALPPIVVAIILVRLLIGLYRPKPAPSFHHIFLRSLP